MDAFQTYVDAVAKYYVYGSAAMILVLTVAWPYIGGVEVILYDIPQGAEPGITHVGITAALASFRGDHAGDHTIKTESCSGLLAEDIGELTCRTVKTTSALLAIFCLIVVARVWHHTWASLITIGAGLVAGILTGFFAGAEYFVLAAAPTMAGFHVLYLWWRPVPQAGGRVDLASSTWAEWSLRKPFVGDEGNPARIGRYTYIFVAVAYATVVTAWMSALIQVKMDMKYKSETAHPHVGGSFTWWFVLVVLSWLAVLAGAVHAVVVYGIQKNDVPSLAHHMGSYEYAAAGRM